MFKIGRVLLKPRWHLAPDQEDKASEPKLDALYKFTEDI